MYKTNVKTGGVEDESLAWPPPTRESRPASDSAGQAIIGQGTVDWDALHVNTSVV